jgi:hypothetical protein
VEFGQELDLQKIILEGRRSEIVNVVKANDRNLSKFEHIVNEVIDVLNELQHWQIFRVKRDANCASHGLGKVVVIHVIN